MSVRILGLSASPRNGRRPLPLERLASCGTVEECHDVLRQPASQALAVLADGGDDFVDQYRTYGATRAVGWSNTEIALAHALWGASRAGAEIDARPLVDYYSISSARGRTEALKDLIRSVDGLVLATPVYFGDRSSLAQSLLSDLAKDDELRRELHSKVFGGIAVGAKRNGGQETTLLFQLFDAVRVGFAGVGNGDVSTAQYGGTCVGGDVGSIATDTYGLGTAAATGKRVATIASLIKRGSLRSDGSAPRVLMLILRDSDGIGLRLAQRIATALGSEADATTVDLTDGAIFRCIGCDICPTRPGDRSEYRCIITSERDSLSTLHEHLAAADVVVPVTVSRRESDQADATYQAFVERSRYLRRDGYAWGDAVVVPVVVHEHDADPALPLRVVTSMIRHSTVMRAPVLLRSDDGSEVAYAVDRLREGGELAGAVRRGQDGTDDPREYIPDGYVISKLRRSRP